QPHLAPPHRPSFPTRRSSDLHAVAGLGEGPRHGEDRGATCKDFGARHLDGLTAGCIKKDRLGQPVTNLEFHVPSSACRAPARHTDRKSTRLNSSHVKISYAVF